MRTRRLYTLRGDCLLISEMSVRNADDFAVVTMSVRHLPTVSHSAEVGGHGLRHRATGALGTAICSTCFV